MLARFRNFFVGDNVRTVAGFKYINTFPQHTLERLDLYLEFTANFLLGFQVLDFY